MTESTKSHGHLATPREPLLLRADGTPWTSSPRPVATALPATALWCAELTPAAGLDGHPD